MKETISPGCPPGNNEEILIKYLSSIKAPLKSHPERRLQDHLQGVWENCRILRANHAVPVDSRGLMIAALTHDAGKAHPYFQKYLQGIGSGIPHAAPSAWVTFCLSRHCNMPIDESLWMAEVVRRHHTHLYNQQDLWYDWFPENTPNPTKSILSYLLKAPLSAINSKDLQSLKMTLFDLNGSPNLGLWLKVRLAYSLLIASDRLDALGIKVTSEKSGLFFSPPEDNFEQNEINRWRADLQQISLKNASREINAPGVYTLSMPTGAGKTLTAFKIAGDIIERLNLKGMIYALPFISIIEQTADAAASYFGSDNIQQDHSLFLDTEHKPGSTSQDEEGQKMERMVNLFRYWHAPVILTTMVQLWDILFSPRANKTMNFHKLCNAVIILDEPQSIPVKYWQGFGQLLQFMSQAMGSVFILMSATQPHILPKTQKSYELAPQKCSFPKARHNYHIQDMEKAYEINSILSIINSQDLCQQQAGLVVMNTRRAALEAFDLLWDQYKNQGIKPQNWFFLSTWLTPKHRRRVLKRLKAAEDQQQKRILVSTQVVEAGVDLDFNWVIRDFAPLDSLIQVAGRCNRHLKQPQMGSVYITRLCQDENNPSRPFANYVYSKVMLEATRTILSNRSSFNNQEIPQIIDAYYQTLSTLANDENLTTALLSGSWDLYQPLIEYRGQHSISLIIEEDETVLPLIQTLSDGQWSLSNLEEKRKLTRRLMQHVIDVPIKEIESLGLFYSQSYSDEAFLEPVLNEKMMLLRKSAIWEDEDHAYHPKKGFVPRSSDEDALIY